MTPGEAITKIAAKYANLKAAALSVDEWRMYDRQQRAEEKAVLDDALHRMVDE